MDQDQRHVGQIYGERGAYARADHDQAASIARALNLAGFTVFWDINLAAGASWANVIEKELNSAAVVIVLWSARSVTSDWVRVEADFALRQQKLVPVLLDDVSLPLGFSQIQAADLRGWDGSPDDPGFDVLLQAVVHIAEPPSARPSLGYLPGEVIDSDLAREYQRLLGASRTRIFVAHASADKPRLRPILVTLVDQGFRLWVDKLQLIGLGAAYESRLARDRIQYGQDWRESIRIAVAGADPVLAFWSHDAVDGRREQFHYEVYMGMMQNKLNQCRIDEVALTEIGMPYTFDQIADLSQVSLGVYHPELDYLMQDIVRRRRAWWRLW